MKECIVLIACLFAVGCSNANLAALSAWGKVHEVRCFSGGKQIFLGHTTGKVENEHQSDGYYFQDEDTGKFTTITADCIITVEK